MLRFKPLPETSFEKPHGSNCDSLDDRIRKSKLEDKAMYDGSKMEGGGTHGGGSNGGQSHGGGAVIPVYAAGAANKNHQPPSHRGAADCNLDKIKNSSMLMIIFVYSLMMFFLLT
ncbi:hypothetical protein QL285_019124 [Trifolium repens]|nr:hypothetical protein QL285_019124 [Trifolium repens]